jgi:hypothetical protein
MQTKWDFAGSTDMWSTSAGGNLMKVVNLTGFTVIISVVNALTFVFVLINCAFLFVVYVTWRFARCLGISRLRVNQSALNVLWNVYTILCVM